MNGHKRHIAVDTAGLLLAVVGNRQRPGPGRRPAPAAELSWADGGYAGKLVTWAKTRVALTLQIVKGPDDCHTFTVLPCRWVVERTFAWISTHRRCTRDYEPLPASHQAVALWATAALMTQRLAQAQ